MLFLLFIYWWVLEGSMQPIFNFLSWEHNTHILLNAQINQLLNAQINERHYKSLSQWEFFTEEKSS